MHQYLFYIGTFPIRAYGLLFMLGIISSGIAAYYIMKKDGRHWHLHIFDFTLCCGLAGIVGGRLWDVFFFDWAYYHNHLTEIPYVWQGGMAIQGGLLFGAVAGVIYTKIHHIDTTGGSFGIVYPETTLAHRTYGNSPLWPAEVWEGQVDILVFVALLLYSVFPHKKGQVFCVYVMLYAVERFFLEYLRGDYVSTLWAFKSAQWTSIIAFVTALAIWIVLQIYGKEDEKLKSE